MPAKPWRTPQVAGLESYLSDLKQFPEIPLEEEETLYASAAAGNAAARERIVLGHLSMVVRIAYKYSGFGLPMADLISEGNLGLLRAAELFNPKFGVPFSTYAAMWIKQRMHRAITAQSHAVRIPVWRSQRLRKLDRLHAELNAELGRDTEISELANRIGMPEEELARVEADRVSVDSIGEETVLVEESNVLPLEKLSREELLEEITASLSGLDDTELQIISLKFGLLEDQPESYREMAPRFGRSREWIRRIGETALAKVKASLASVGHLPRALVEARKKQARERLVTLAKSRVTAQLSVMHMALIQWLEPLIAIA